MYSHDFMMWLYTDFELMTRFIVLFDTQRVTTLYRLVLRTHTNVHSYIFIAVAW
jgi:hypothetical protein